MLMVVGCYVIDYCAGSLCSPSTITFSFTIYVTYENRSTEKKKRFRVLVEGWGLFIVGMEFDFPKVFL